MLNNAGIGSRPGPLQWLNMNDYHKVASVNLFGVINVTMTFLPLIKKEKGRIVNTSKIFFILFVGLNFQPHFDFERSKEKNIDLTIPGNWSFEIRRIS